MLGVLFLGNLIAEQPQKWISHLSQSAFEHIITLMSGFIINSYI